MGCSTRTTWSLLLAGVVDPAGGSDRQVGGALRRKDAEVIVAELHLHVPLLPSNALPDLMVGRTSHHRHHRKLDAELAMREQDLHRAPVRLILATPSGV